MPATQTFQCGTTYGSSVRASDHNCPGGTYAYWTFNGHLATAMFGSEVRFDIWVSKGASSIDTGGAGLIGISWNHTPAFQGETFPFNGVVTAPANQVFIDDGYWIICHFTNNKGIGCDGYATITAGDVPPPPYVPGSAIAPLGNAGLLFPGMPLAPGISGLQPLPPRRPPGQSGPLVVLPGATQASPAYPGPTYPAWPPLDRRPGPELSATANFRPAVVGTRGAGSGAASYGGGELMGCLQRVAADYLTTAGLALPVNLPMYCSIDHGGETNADWLKVSPGLYNQAGTAKNGNIGFRIYRSLTANQQTGVWHPTPAGGLGVPEWVGQGTYPDLIPWGGKVQYTLEIVSSDATVPSASSLELVVEAFNAT